MLLKKNSKKSHGLPICHAQEELAEVLMKHGAVQVLQNTCGRATISKLELVKTPAQRTVDVLAQTKLSMLLELSSSMHLKS